MKVTGTEHPLICCCCSAYGMADCQCKNLCFKGVSSCITCMNCFLTWQVNLEYLEGKLEALDGEELMKIKDNINCLFQHCIQALGEEHPIRVVNALQVPCWATGNALFCFWWWNVFAAGIKHLVLTSLLLGRCDVYRAVATVFGS